MTRATQPPTARAQLTDAAGALGAIVAAFCCAGTPMIVAALAATGLSALRKDAILWPIMLASLAVAIWGYWQGALERQWSGTPAIIVTAIVVKGSSRPTPIWAGLARRLRGAM